MITQAQIHLELAKEEGKLLQGGDNISLNSEVSLSVLIGTGLDLDDQQDINDIRSLVAYVIDKS